LGRIPLSASPIVSWRVSRGNSTSLRSRSELALPLGEVEMPETLELAVDPLAEELPADARAWTLLLEGAYAAGGPESYLLHALRALRLAGARIEARAGGARLVPGKALGDEWPTVRREWLIPHAGLLKRLLAEVTEAAESPDSVASL